MEIDNKYTPQVSFAALKIKKNIVQDLPDILKQHELYLRLAVAPNDEFISKYGTTTPTKMIEKVTQNQKDNNLYNIIIGYFRFGKNPFSEKVAGIAIEKQNKTVIKQPLDFSITRTNTRTDSFASSNTYKSDVRSNLFDQFEQAENMVSRLTEFTPIKKVSGDLEIVGNYHERIITAIEQSPLIAKLRELHNIKIDTDFRSVIGPENTRSYERYFTIKWQDNENLEYKITGEGVSMKLTDDDAIRKLMQTPFEQIRKQIAEKHHIDISNPTLEKRSPNLLDKFLELFE